MRLILRQILVDHDRLRRAVEIVFNFLDLGDLRQLGDVERAVLEGEPVRTIEARGDDFHLALAALLDDGVDLVLQAAADEDRALVALTQRTRVRHIAGIELDIKALLQLQLAGDGGKLVHGRWDRRRRDRGKLHRGFTDGTSLRPGQIFQVLPHRLFVFQIVMLLHQAVEQRLVARAPRLLQLDRLEFLEGAGDRRHVDRHRCGSCPPDEGIESLEADGR